jgi:CheY-like chemotaxis protein
MPGEDKGKILVVDDEADSLEFVRAILEPEGFSVITAMNGEEGLKKAVSEQPHLIIMDVQMPVKDGFQTFYEMKHNEAIKDIPVIMLTGVRDKVGIGFSADQMQEFMEVRPEEYLEKPINPDKLKEIVKKIFKIEK